MNYAKAAIIVGQLDLNRQKFFLSQAVACQYWPSPGRPLSESNYKKCRLHPTAAFGSRPHREQKSCPILICDLQATRFEWGIDANTLIRQFRRYAFSPVQPGLRLSRSQ
jgi:hypothetical protein